MQILHLSLDSVFITGFQELCREHLTQDQHHFLIRVPHKSLNDDRSAIPYKGNGLAWLVRLISAASKSDKIVVHGLFDHWIVLILFLWPRWLNKCHWVVYGGDLYRRDSQLIGLKNRLYERIRGRVIRRMRVLITYIDGDYRFAQEQYGARGRMARCNMYTSNTFSRSGSPLPWVTSCPGLKILVGNSATRTNNHGNVIDLLYQSREKMFSTICPLSYGDEEYAGQVEQYGKDKLGERFIVLKNFMTLEEYRRLLNSVDIAIFAYDRQQGMGNIINLLGAGKKVYLKKTTSTWQIFRDMGVKVYDINYLEISPIETNIAESNQELIARHFSKGMLVAQWNSILSEKL